MVVNFLQQILLHLHSQKIVRAQIVLSGTNSQKSVRFFKLASQYIWLQYCIIYVSGMHNVVRSITVFVCVYVCISVCVHAYVCVTYLKCNSGGNVKLKTLAVLNFDETLHKNFDERNVDKKLVKTLIFVLYCTLILVALLWKVKVWRLDPDSPNSSKFPLVKDSGFTVMIHINAGVLQ